MNWITVLSSLKVIIPIIALLLAGWYVSRTAKRKATEDEHEQIRADSHQAEVDRADVETTVRNTVDDDLDDKLSKFMRDRDQR